MAALILQNTTVYLLLKSARPRQWIKNFALYAALLFSGFFFERAATGIPYALVVLYAVGIFSLVASSVYIINDISDVEADRKHPFKRKRPIASGALPIPIAAGAAFGLLLAAGFFSLFLPLFFRLLLIAYIVLQFAYAKKLKHVPILDVASIATGFLIRVYAGAVVVNLHMNVWFLLTVISASLFLAVGKRQSERTLLSKLDNQDLGRTRKILLRYSERLLDQFTAMFATATWLTYALFAFQNEARPAPEYAFFYTFLPKTLHSEKLLMLTLPFVIFGVMRYLQLVYESNQGESPERVLLNDKPLLATVFSFGLVVLFVIYVL